MNIHPAYAATLLAAGLLTVTAPGAVLVGFDGSANNNNPTTSLPGVSGLVNTTEANGTQTGGSDDGFFGLDTGGGLGFGGASTATGTGNRIWRIFPGALGTLDTLRVRINNDTGGNLRIDAILFDFAKSFNGSLDTIDVRYESGGLGITDGTLIETVTATTTVGGGGVGDYEDYFISLGALTSSERTLADGTFAWFRFEGSDSLGATNSYFDNIAFVQVVPEPSTLALLGIGGLLLSGRRRRVQG